MAQWVSFDELKSRVSMKDVLAHYGLMQGTTEKASKRGIELRLRCPFHEDKTPSLSISAETGKFHCFGCHAKGGDIFDFVVAKEGISAGDRTKSRRQAALLIKDWFGVGSEATPEPEKSAAADVSTPVEDVTPLQAPIEERLNPPLTFTFKQALRPQSPDFLRLAIRTGFLEQKTVQIFTIFASNSSYISDCPPNT